MDHRADVAWASRESRQRLLDQLAGNIGNFFQNQPFNQITDALNLTQN